MADIGTDKDFWDRLRRKIGQLTRRSNDVDDLLHDAFLRLERYKADKKVENPAGFLVFAALNLGVDQYRREKRQDPGLYENILEIRDNSPLQDEVIAARARLDRVRLGLERLSPRTREVFLMCRLDGLKHAEVAHRLGISESAVEKHVAKAMLFLVEWTAGF